MVTSDVPHVRDEPASYGPHEVDDDAFPAARVLEDLARAADRDAARVIARYAALRDWLLRQESADPVLLRHSRGAARAYLAAVDGPEAAALARLADPEPELAAFHRAGRAATRAGHTEGAYALLLAGYTAARRRADFPWAARLAADLAALLEEQGLDGVALWTRRAEQLRRLDR